MSNVQRAEHELVTPESSQKLVPSSEDTIEPQVAFLVLAAYLLVNNQLEDPSEPNYARYCPRWKLDSSKMAPFGSGWLSIPPPGMVSVPVGEQYPLRQLHQVAYADMGGWMSDMWDKTLSHGKI